MTSNPKNTVGGLQRIKMRIILIYFFPAIIAGCSGSTDSNPVVQPGIPPAQITDIVTGEVTASRVKLTWTAPGDDGDTGQATSYQLRVAEFEITPETWEQADVPQYNGLLVPSQAGAPDSVQIRYLKPDTAYWVAIRAVDSQGYISEVSEYCELKTSTQNHLKLESNFRVGGEAKLERLFSYQSSRILCLTIWGSYFDTMGKISSFNLTSPESPFHEGFFGGVGSVHNVCWDGNLILFLSTTIGSYGMDQKTHIFVHGALPDGNFLGSCVIEDPSTGAGISASIAALGDYLFLARGRLLLVDLVTPTLPFRRNEYDLSFPVHDLKVIGPRLLAWDNGTDTPLMLVDVSTPWSPVVVGSYDPPAEVKAVALLDNLICIHTTDGYLRVLDVTDPVAPLLRGSVVLDHDIVGLAALGKTAYTVGPESGLRFYSLDDPDVPVLSGTYDVAMSPTRILTVGDLVVVHDSVVEEGVNLLIMSTNGR